MEEPPLSKQALARIEAARLEAGADLLGGLAAFWRGIGMSSKALREHDPAELMPLFERYAEKEFDAEAKELLACFPDPDAYSFKLILLPMKVAMRICPTSGIILPENVSATDWTDLYRTLKAAAMKSGRKGLGEGFQQLSGDWENYLDHSFSRQFLKGKITTTTPEKESPIKAFMLLFWLKYLFHLRLFANNQRFIQRICTHLSERLHVWRAEASRRILDADPPPIETVPDAPQVQPAGATFEPALAKKAIEHLLKLATQQKKNPPETVSLISANFLATTVASGSPSSSLYLAKVSACTRWATSPGTATFPPRAATSTRKRRPSGTPWSARATGSPARNRHNGSLLAYSL
jgi:hypothetical protein